MLDTILRRFGILLAIAFNVFLWVCAYFLTVLILNKLGLI